MGSYLSTSLTELRNSRLRALIKLLSSSYWVNASAITLCTIPTEGNRLDSFTWSARPSQALLAFGFEFVQVQSDYSKAISEIKASEVHRSLSALI
ncbi:hypothetical protein V6N12_016126 [Hibiscus sabdariffa]|uniref:Uncharacterized protein n=1 Tax=Hibiscus sabdariffa TaxID=183260 RepID=A0ABR2C8T9_9ROSI